MLGAGSGLGQGSAGALHPSIDACCASEGGTRRGTQCASIGKAGAGPFPAVSGPGSIWHTRPWGRREAVVAFQQGRVLWELQERGREVRYSL